MQIRLGYRFRVLENDWQWLSIYCRKNQQCLYPDVLLVWALSRGHSAPAFIACGSHVHAESTTPIMHTFATLHYIIAVIDVLQHKLITLLHLITKKPWRLPSTKDKPMCFVSLCLYSVYYNFSNDDIYMYMRRTYGHIVYSISIWFINSTEKQAVHFYLFSSFLIVFIVLNT